jgi:hypothetical protein
MRIAIAIPHSDYFTVPWKFAQSLMLLNNRMNKVFGNVELVMGTCSNVTKNRNDLLKVVRSYDACLMIDSDMTFAPTVGEELIKHLETHDIVCGSYVNGTYPYNPAIYKYTDKFEPIEPQGLQEIDGCGFGFVALGKKAMQLTFEESEGMGEDLTFCLKAKNQGLKILCDSSQKVGHLRLLGLDMDNRKIL